MGLKINFKLQGGYSTPTPTGEYSAKKIIFSWPAKNCEKVPHFFTFRSGKLSKIALVLEKIVKISIIWGKNRQNLHFFEYKLQKFANSGVKIEKNIVKSIKICTLFG